MESCYSAAHPSGQTKWPMSAGQLIRGKETQPHITMNGGPSSADWGINGWTIRAHSNSLTHTQIADWLAMLMNLCSADSTLHTDGWTACCGRVTVWDLKWGNTAAFSFPSSTSCLGWGLIWFRFVPLSAYFRPSPFSSYQPLTHLFDLSEESL